jgi:hypothetical protein
MKLILSRAPTRGGRLADRAFYRALHLLADVAQGRVMLSLAREGGLQSTLWAGERERSNQLLWAIYRPCALRRASARRRPLHHRDE